VRSLRIRLAALLLASMMVMSLAGCRPPAAGPSIDAARTFAGQFMCARLSGKVEDARAMLSSAGAKSFGGPGQPDLDLRESGDICGYAPVSELSREDGKTFVFVYRLQQTGREVAYAAFWDETITVTSAGTGTSFLVDAATEGAATEARVDESMVLRLVRDGVESELFGLDDLPDEYTPLGASDDITMGVGKEGFALLSFAPSGTRLAFVTWGVHGFLGYVALSGSAPEGIDIHWEGLTVDTVWSPDSQYIAAVIEQPTGNSALSVYRVTPPERLQLGVETMFAPEDYRLERPVWLDTGRLTVEVEHRDAPQDSKNGQWLIDIGTRTISRPPSGGK